MNDGSGAIVIEPPFTLQFNLIRSTQATLNTADITIYNLSQRTRDRIYQDRFDFSAYRKVILEAGYDTLSTVFIGSLFEAYSVRQGADIITNINSRDGGFDVVGTKTYRTIQAGATNAEVVDGLVNDFPNLQLGAVGNFDQTFKRPVVLNGNTYDLVKRYTGGNVYVDLEKVYALQQNEFIDGDLPVINAASGLLETPRRDDAFLTVTTLFEPRVIMGQQVRLESLVLPQYNGNYKVIAVHHQGIISEAEGGSCTSRFNLLVGTQVFGSVVRVDGNN